MNFESIKDTKTGDSADLNESSKFSKITIIAAIDENNVLGKDNQLIWHLPEDLMRFKRLTTGHAIIMGRKTFVSSHPGGERRGGGDIICWRNFKNVYCLNISTVFCLISN